MYVLRVAMYKYIDVQSGSGCHSVCSSMYAYTYACTCIRTHIKENCLQCMMQYFLESDTRTSYAFSKVRETNKLSIGLVNCCQYTHTLYNSSRYVFTYIRTYVHTYMHVHTYIRTYVYMFVAHLPSFPVLHNPVPLPLPPFACEVLASPRSVTA